MARPKRKIPLEDLEYDVVKEWEADGFRWAILKIRNYESNARITVKIPIRTPEEDAKVLEPFVRAACELVHPEIRGKQLQRYTLINDWRQPERAALYDNKNKQ